MEDSNKEPIRYPSILERVKAAFTDSLVLIGLMFLVSTIFSSIEYVPDSTRIIAFIVIWGCYDPIFTSLFGGTIGHLMVNIRVKKRGYESKNISFPFAIVRYVLKFFLGWISLITVGTNEKRLAIHDIVSKSIVVFHTKK